MAKINYLLYVRPYIFIAIAAFFISGTLWGDKEMEPEDAYVGNGSRSTSSTSSAAVELAFEKAMKEAQTRGHESFTIEHILLALLDEASTREILKANAVNIESLRAAMFSHIESSFSSSSDVGKPTPHPLLGQVLRRAVMKSYLSNKKEAEGADILEAILAEGNSFAAQALQDNGLTLEFTENQVLERYLARAAQETKRLDKLLQQMEEQKKFPDPAHVPDVATIEAVSGQSRAYDVGHKSYVLRVTSKDPEVVSFKAAVTIPYNRRPNSGPFAQNSLNIS